MTEHFQEEKISLSTFKFLGYPYTMKSRAVDVVMPTSACWNVAHTSDWKGRRGSEGKCDKAGARIGDGGGSILGVPGALVTVTAPVCTAMGSEKGSWIAAAG